MYYASFMQNESNFCLYRSNYTNLDTFNIEDQFARKKILFLANQLSRKIEKLNMKEKKEIQVTWSPTATITPKIIDYTITTHNGKRLGMRP